MIRLATTLLAIATIFFSIKAFIKSMRSEDLANRVTAFFLLIISSVLLVIVMFDAYSTWVLLAEIIAGDLGLREPAIFPGTAPLYGIWEHPIAYVFTLDALCVATLAGVVLRKRIPGLLVRDVR